METKLFFTSIPKVTGLKYYKATIEANGVGFPIFASKFNHHKIAARRIIETIEDVLSAPINGNLSSIHVIVSFESFRKENFFLFAKKMNLTLTGPYSLHETVYLECLRFTLAVKMSPEWNRVNNFYIKGNGFIGRTNQAVEAIQLEMLLTGECLCLLVKPFRLKMSQMNFTKMEMSFEGFAREGLLKIQQKVFILPDLKPAMAHKIYSKLPNNCPFNDYADVRDYWRVLHGYHLLENEENMAYVEVSFTWSNTTYIYPQSCVCFNEPLFFRHNKESVVVGEFLSAMEKKLPKICGRSFRFSEKDRDSYHPVVKFHPATETVIGRPNVVKFSGFDGGASQTRCEKIDGVVSESIHAKDSKLKESSPRVQTVVPKTLNETFKCCRKIITPRHKTNFSSKTTIYPPKPKKILKLNAGNEVPTRVEMETAARLNYLELFTVSKLMEFCKGNNIRIGSKERKKDLVEKICQFLSLKPVFN